MQCVVLVFSYFHGAVMTTMGLKMMVTAFLFLIIGLVNAEPELLTPRFEIVDYSTNLDNPQYRLLDSVQPTYAHLDLDVYLNESRFDGIIRIQILVNNNVTQIVLHQSVASISGVNVVDVNNNQVDLESQNAFETDNYFEIIKLNFASVVTVGVYTITIRYVGRINENPLDRGFYKGYYHIGNEIRQYATTQFQPVHARKAFPFFDEPQFKCPFVISITRDANLRESYSNMPIGLTEQLSASRVRETFLPTPIISAYLVAFHVSDFVYTNATSTVAKPFQIIAREGVNDQHPYAADVGLRITNELDDYLNISYYDMGQGSPMKNDHIALPDFPSGAMENWGMVNYREAYLLYDEKNTNIVNKIFITTIIAHELAHKWFGNLVTCFWWSNLWINESFASYIEYFTAHAVEPILELDEQYIVDQVQSALSADSSASATSMNLSSVADNPSVSAHFSTTSYAKGSSVLRMLEHFVGSTTFRNGLRYYLRDNAYGLAYPEDVYRGFRAAVAEDTSFSSTYPGVDIGAVFDSWVQNRGSPVLNVDVNMSSGNITITQERFQLSGTIPNTLWQIPITWTHGGSPNFTNLKPTSVLTTQSAVVQMDPGHNWVVFNLASSGLYRVNYDDHNWEMLASQLRSNRAVIHKLSRSQIVNDVLFFIRANKISIERAFDVLSFLEHETDYYVWAGAITQLDWMRRRLEHLPAAHAEFSAYLLELLEASVQHVGFNERSNDTTSVTLQRMQIYNYACQLGHEGCISDSVARWQQYRANDTELVSVNTRRYVYCNGLREGNASDYNFLFQKYNTSENTADMVVILRTLACTRDNASLIHYLRQSMYNDRIRIHDRTNAFNFALQGNKENLRVVLDFLYANFAEIRDTYGGPARLNTAINALATYLTDFRDIVEFQSWLYTNQIALGSSFNAGVNVINAAMNNLVWGNDAATEIFDTLRSRNASPGLSASFAVVLVALVARFLN